MDTQTIIRDLDLARHPEGGWYREVHRSERLLSPPGYAGPRAAMTAIYFLLGEGDFSAFHTVRSEEAWVYLSGAPLELVTLSPVLAKTTLGPVEEGMVPIHLVPPDVLQAARPCGRYSLVACFVAPGFHFADFRMPLREELLPLYPEHEDVITSLTRSP